VLSQNFRKFVDNKKIELTREFITGLRFRLGKFLSLQIILLYGKLGQSSGTNDAVVWVIKNGINLLMNDKNYATKMFEEQDRTPYDRVMFHHRIQRLCKDRLQYSTIFGQQGQTHSDDYKQPTVIAYNQVPHLQKLRQFLPELLGDKAKDLNCKGTYYFRQELGARFLGKAEQKLAICCSLGRATTLRVLQRLPKHSPVRYKSITIRLEHGDLYIVSEKAGTSNKTK
jgi:hypothetical protein